MRDTSSLPFGTNRLGAVFVAWLASWRRVFFFGALAVVMWVSKSHAKLAAALREMGHKIADSSIEVAWFLWTAFRFR